MKRKGRVDSYAPQISVDSTALVQKKIRRNIAKAAVNRLDRTRARKVSELLASINNNGHEVTSQPSNRPAAHKGIAGNSKPAAQVV